MNAEPSRLIPRKLAANLELLIINKKQYAFVQRCASSSSFFMRSFELSDAFHESPFFSHYPTLLQENDRMKADAGALLQCLLIICIQWWV